MRAAITMNKYDTFSLPLHVLVVAGYILVPSHYNISTSFGVISLHVHHCQSPFTTLSTWPLMVAIRCAKKKKKNGVSLNLARLKMLPSFALWIYFFLNFVRTADLLLCFVSFPHFFQHAKIYCCCW